MEKRGWNNADLAREAKLSRQSIGYYVTGRIPDAESLKKIAKAMDVTLDELLRLVNVLPPVDAKTARQIELENLIKQIPDNVLNEVLEYIRFRTRKK